MNVLDTVLAAEKRADEAILNAENEAKNAVEAARAQQVEKLKETKKKLSESEAVAMEAKQAEVSKKVAQIESEASLAVSGIKSSFEAKRNSAISAVKKYFA